MVNNSKVHIKQEHTEKGITINVFSDSPAEAIGLLVDTLAHLQANTATAAVKAACAQPSPPAQALRPKGNGSGGAVNLPVCKQCGSSNDLAEVQFTNQDTGQLMTRFKCQTCKIWVGKAF